MRPRHTELPGLAGEKFLAPTCFATHLSFSESWASALFQLLIASSPRPCSSHLRVSFGSYSSILLLFFTAYSCRASIRHCPRFFYRTASLQLHTNPCLQAPSVFHDRSPTHRRKKAASTAHDGQRPAHGLEITTAISTWPSTSTGHL